MKPTRPTAKAGAHLSKKEIHQRFVDQFTSELESITAAAKRSFATATSEEHRAEGKYDTFKLESSFLSRGLAMRVDELTRALQSLQELPLVGHRPSAPIQPGDLIRLKDGDDKTVTLFLGDDVGGETIMANGEEISIVSARSPLGQAVQGKTTGETFTLKIGSSTRTYTVVSVE
jgi:transcription elongation GreA/GreB family factor